MRERLVYIDWMKVIGIYFIIAGHMFSLGSDYIYTFSVSLFFAISGFLCHYEEDSKVFWSKLWRNLIVPMLLMCIIILMCEVVIRVLLGKIVWSMIPIRLYNILVGNQGKGVTGGGVGMCWFIYTLAICKIIYQYVVKYRYVNATIICFFLLFAFIYNKHGIYVYNSIINTTLAYPTFVGETVRKP